MVIAGGKVSHTNCSAELNLVAWLPRGSLIHGATAYFNTKASYIEYTMKNFSDHKTKLENAKRRRLV